MSVMASQITGVCIIYSTVCSGADKKNTEAPRHWPLWGEFTGDRWIARTKGQEREKVSISWRYHAETFDNIYGVNSQYICLFLNMMFAYKYAL